MPLLRNPTPETIRRFLDSQAELGFTYRGVGGTGNTPPDGYVVDHIRASLGRGDKVFASARVAMETWQQFQLGWVEAWPADTAIRQGEVVAIVAKSVGLWWLNACRIAYVVDDESKQKRFGFANGTLPGHAGSGEERFLIEMDDDGTVWYDIFAFSRPHHPLAYVGYPYVRRVQKQFGRQSVAAMQKLGKGIGHEDNGGVSSISPEWRRHGEG